MYQRSMASVNELESQFGALWTQCQRCQGSLHQVIHPLKYWTQLFGLKFNNAADLECAVDTLPALPGLPAPGGFRQVSK